MGMDAQKNFNQNEFHCDEDVQFVEISLISNDIFMLYQLVVLIHLFVGPWS